MSINSILNIEHLLFDPIGKESFINSYWQKKPLLIQENDPNRYSNLLNINGIDEILTTNLLNELDIRMMLNNRLVPEYEYMVNTYSKSYVDASKVMLKYNEGGTIILEHIQKYNHLLADLCRDTSSCLDATKEIFANIYLTPPHSQGFQTHFDEQDVFILQIAGSKRLESIS